MNFAQHTWENGIYSAETGSLLSATNATDGMLYGVGVNTLGADFNNAGAGLMARRRQNKPTPMIALA